MLDKKTEAFYKAFAERLKFQRRRRFPMTLKKLSAVGFVSIGIAILSLALLLFPLDCLAQKKGGILKIGYGMTAVKMDPHLASGSGDIYIDAQIFERLIYYRWNEKTKQAEPIPWLATKWEVTPDKMTWTFYLRKGVEFTDGTSFDAEAVKFNFERLLGPPAGPFTNTYLPLIKNVEVVDKYTVKVNLKVPAVPVESFFVQSYIGMMSPASVKEWGDKVGAHPTGTGPYKLKEWLQGEKVVLEANNKYWGGRPNLDQIEYIFVPESSARMNMLKSGQVDMAFNLDITDLETVLQEKKFNVVEYPTTELLSLTLNNVSKPTNDMAVRQAIKLAIDSKGIVEKILKGHAAVADSPVAPVIWGSHPSEPLIWDPEKAKKILTDAGWIPGKEGVREKSGERLTLKVRYPTGRYAMCDEVVAVIQNQLNNAGFECISEKMGFGAWITAALLPLEKTTGDSFIISLPGKEDAHWVLSRMTAKSPTSFYQNKSVHKMIDEQFVEWDKAKRKELLKQIQIVATREAYCINLYFSNYNIVFKKNVHGVEATKVPVSDSFNVLKVWME
jgi:ABC-type transport system substrate-binding protein